MIEIEYRVSDRVFMIERIQIRILEPDKPLLHPSGAHLKEFRF